MVVPQIITTLALSQIIRLTLDSSSSVRSIALKLLKSRKQPDFDIGRTVTETSRLFSTRLVDEFHFYSYAKSYWLRHILCVLEQEPVMDDLLLRLFKGNTVNMNATDEYGWTPLLMAAKAKGAAVMTGRELAIYQAADAFELFTGLTPSSTEIGIAFDEVMAKGYSASGAA